MTFTRASFWFLVLVVGGCGKEFDATSGGEGGGGASSDASLASDSLVSRDVGSTGSGGNATGGAKGTGGRDTSGGTGGHVTGSGGATTGSGGASGSAQPGADASDARGPDTVPDSSRADTGSAHDAQAEDAPPRIVADAGPDTVVRPDVQVVLHGCSTNVQGPALVEVPASNGTTYCIDSTEVTNAQYAAFLAAMGGDASASDQDAWCSWNTTYVPMSNWPTARDNNPVVSVDWCDAAAYCKWAGKSLCGKIGGGPNLQADANYAPLDQWYNACSLGGTLAYPYGATYDSSACNGSDKNLNAPLDVASEPACTGGYPRLFDMSGNLAEWEDSCDGTTGGGDYCRLRGGAFINPDTDLRCDMIGGTFRNYWYLFAGIRCCAPSLP